MDDELRLEASKLVVRLLESVRGKEIADFWAWELTPMPCGVPSWEQLAEALRMAVGDKAPPDRDAAVARAANLRWHAVYGAALVHMLMRIAEEGRNWESLLGELVQRARSLADQSERCQPAAEKEGEDGKA